MHKRKRFLVIIFVLMTIFGFGRSIKYVGKLYKSNLVIADGTLSPSFLDMLHQMIPMETGEVGYLNLLPVETGHKWMRRFCQIQNQIAPKLLRLGEHYLENNSIEWFIIDAPSFEMGKSLLDKYHLQVQFREGGFFLVRR